MNNTLPYYHIPVKSIVEKIKTFSRQNGSKPPTVYKVTKENGTYVFICDIRRNSAEVIVGTLSLSQDYATVTLGIIGGSAGMVMIQNMERSIRASRRIKNLKTRTPLEAELKQTFSHFQQDVRDFGNLLSYVPKEENGQPRWADVTRAQTESIPEWLNNRNTRKLLTRALYQQEDGVRTAHLSHDLHTFFENLYNIFCVEDHATSAYVWDSTSIQTFLADENTRKYLEEFQKFVDEQKMGRKTVDETVRAWVELKDLTVPSSRVSSLSEPRTNGQQNDGQGNNAHPGTYYFAVDININSTGHQDRRYEAIEPTQLVAKIEQGIEIFYKDINGQYLKVNSTVVHQEQNQEERGSSQLENMRLLIDRAKSIQSARPTYSNPLCRFVACELHREEDKITESEIRSFLQHNILAYAQENPENFENLLNALTESNKIARQENTPLIQDLYSVGTMQQLFGTVRYAHPPTIPIWRGLGQLNWMTIIIPVVGSTFWFFKASWKNPFHRQPVMSPPPRILPAPPPPVKLNTETDWKQVVSLFNQHRVNSMQWLEKNAVPVSSVSSFAAGWFLRGSPLALPVTLIGITGQRENVVKFLKALVNNLTRKGGS